MQKILAWMIANKFVSCVILVLIFVVVGKKSSVSPMRLPMIDGLVGSSEIARDSAQTMISPSMGVSISPDYNPVAPADTSVRMVTKDTSLSLRVDDVSASLPRIESIANEAGGYMIDSNLSKPEGAASGTISLRVPADKRSEVLESLRRLAIDVVSESVSGHDITDQFVDNDERLRILQSTKEKFETILADAKNIQDMLQVQREILTLQNQIDSIKGQQKYLEGSAKYSRVTVFLATDELALPYHPDNAWRPTVIFKEAVRSLVLTFRQVGTVLIWVLVYTPVVLFVGMIFWMTKYLRNRK